LTQDDLAAARGADGIVLPKAASGQDVAALDAMLAGCRRAHPSDRDRDARRDLRAGQLCRLLAAPRRDHLGGGGSACRDRRAILA
jgi:hypothetical protein